MIFPYAMIEKLRKLIRCENGGALAELAIMVPFLVLMLAAVSEIGRYFQTYTTLAKGTRASARYLSNHSLNALEIGRATSLVVCGKLSCTGGDELVKGVGGGSAFSANNVCIEATTNTVTVRIARTNNCVPVAGAPPGTPYNYQPIFNLGALLHHPFTMALPISPRTTMFKLNI